MGGVFAGGIQIILGSIPNGANPIVEWSCLLSTGVVKVRKNTRIGQQELAY